MTLTEGLLIAIVLVLTVLVLTSSRGKTTPTHTNTWDCVDRGTGAVTSVKMQYTGHGNGCKCPKCSSPEKDAIKENAEYFAGCKDSSEMKKALDCMCDGDDKFEYAINEFGGPGMEFKDWVTSQSVDPQVLKNHAEFVKDRTGNNTQNITGRTYSPDSHMSFESMPWVGLRRPQAVPVCGNTAQVPDIDYSAFETKPKFTWSSSG